GAAQFFEDIFCDEAGMPAGAAGHDDDAMGLGEFVDVLLDAGHRDGAFYRVEAAAEAVEDRIGLLEDLFEHKMVESPFFDGGELEVELLDEGGDLFVAEVFQDKLVGL